MSALEHAIPERFFNDPAKCNAEGTTTPVLGLPVCPQGISAVKAIGLAASQGQKIYTITQTVYQNNPNIVNANLSAHSAATKQAVQNALDIGHEVTIHERPITQSGWTGAGYTTIDPSTGAGGYMIEGGSNGGSLNIEDAVGFLMNVMAEMLSIAGKILQQILGTFLSLLLNILDAKDLFDKCFGVDAVLKPLAFLYMALVLGAIVGYLLSFLPIFLILIGVIYLTLTVNAMKDAIGRGCDK